MKNRRFFMTAGSVLFLLLVWKAQAARAGALQGVALMGQLLIPSLLPFFAAAGLLNRLGFTQAVGRRLAPSIGRLFGVSGSGCAVFLLGLSGGYPLGAAALADLLRRGQLNKKEAQKLLRFCDNTGPSFAVGAVGAVFGSPWAGLYLWGVHVLAAVLTGVLLSRPRENAPGTPLSAPPPEDFAGAFTAAVQSAVQALLNIAGFVIFFSALLSILDSAGFPGTLAGLLSVGTGGELRWWRALLTGLLELSSAVGAMQGLSCTPPDLALAAFILGWGGLCIHFQSMAVLDRTGLKMTERLGGKLLHGVLSGIFAFILAPVFF